MALKEKYVMPGVRTALPIVLERGGGPFVEDVDGNRYVDLSTGISVHNTGHRPAEIVEAVRAQLERLMHICIMVTGYEPYLQLAKRMAEVSPHRQLTRSIFLNSGSEAIENAVKVARSYTRRRHIISFRTAFHGRTLLGVSLTGKERPYREGFGPLFPDVVHLDFPYPYRSPQGEEAGEATLGTLEETLSKKPYEDDVCAVLAEPVQGEGGFIIPPKGFFGGLARICREHGVLFIDDEVQAGLGRTGRFWGIDHWDAVPDLLVSGKALGGGLPIGGVTGREEIMASPAPGSLGGTFGGNPLSCAAGLASVDLIERALPGVPSLARALGERLGEFHDRYPLVGDVRGVGAMWAIELVKDRRSKEPAPEAARKVQLESLKRGIVILTAGYYNNVIRFLPPLNIPLDTLATALDRVGEALAAA